MLDISNLALFSNVANDEVVRLLLTSLDNSTPENEAASAYSQAMAKIYSQGLTSPGEYITKKVLSCDNLFFKLSAAGKTDKVLEENFYAEAEVLGKMINLCYDDYMKQIDCDGYLARFETTPTDLVSILKERIDNIDKYGYGIYADATMFELDDEYNIRPVLNPDDTRLDELIDYEREKNAVYDNTLALIEGKPAANILLTGDAGTGKSSTVKAVANALSNRGLRIIQISKEQLHCLKDLLGELSLNPLKFIVFIDDLSFRHDDDNSRALKAVLEGSVSAKSRNVVIYATSNRRHIIRENMQEREGDEVHRNDAMQETLSLSERFGIHLSFSRPDKKTYLNIVDGLAHAVGLDNIDFEKLHMAAERFALERGLRSARAAKQFVDSVSAGQIKL